MPNNNTQQQTSEQQTALRAVPMTLFPTMESLQSVVELANSQLPIKSANSLMNLLMTYHNTLLHTLNQESK